MHPRAILIAGAWSLIAWSGGETGFIEIETIPGVTIKLDGKFAGVIDKEPLVIRDVAPGAHRIDAWINGFEDQRDLVYVEPAGIVRLRLRPWQPISNDRIVALQNPAPPEAAAPPSGALRVETLPKVSTIESKKLGWRKIPLEGEPFVATHVPAGVHRLTFCNADRCIDYRATIRPDAVTSLVVDFSAGRVRDVSPANEGRWAKSRESCERANDRHACVDACRNELAFGIAGKACAAVVAPDPGLMNVSTTALVPPCEPLESEAPGWLTVEAKTPVEIWRGTTSLGVTPLVKLKMQSGCVELRALDKARGVDKTMRVEITPGRVTLERVDF